MKSEFVMKLAENLYMKDNANNENIKSFNSLDNDIQEQYIIRVFKDKVNGY